MATLPSNSLTVQPLPHHPDPQYFDALVKDWVLHLPCNHAQHGGTNRCVPLGDQSGGPVCKWDPVTHGGACDTGTFESPWRSLEMGIRMAGWPVAFYGFQQSDNFSVDARVLMLLGVSEHLQALEVDGGHPGSGTVNWEMTQWRGLLVAAGAWPELAGAAEASQVSFKYLTKLLESGVYPDGVENEMTSNCALLISLRTRLLAMLPFRQCSRARGLSAALTRLLGPR